MSGSYVERALQVIITLGQGTFGQSGQNTVTLSNLRMAATIKKGGMPGMDTAEVRIWGAQPDVLNAVSTLGVYSYIMQRQANTLQVLAGDAVNGMSIVYFGSITDALADYSGAPDTFLQLIGTTGQLAAMQPVPPSSYPGTADVATIMSNLAAQQGYKFENNGVTTKLSSPYLPGTGLDQIQSVARAANIECVIDSSTSPNTLAIWPKTGTRSGQQLLISAATGLVGYPRFNSHWIGLRCIYNPNFRIGQTIEVQSTVGAPATQAQATGSVPATPGPGSPNGVWTVTDVSYDLAAQLPGGPWFCDLRAARVPGQPSTT